MTPLEGAGGGGDPGGSGGTGGGSGGGSAVNAVAYSAKLVTVIEWSGKAHILAQGRART